MPGLPSVAPPSVRPEPRPDVSPPAAGTFLLYAQGQQIGYLPLNGTRLQKEAAKTLLSLHVRCPWAGDGGQGYQKEFGTGWCCHSVLSPLSELSGFEGVTSWGLMLVFGDVVCAGCLGGTWDKLQDEGEWLPNDGGQG